MKVYIGHDPRETAAYAVAEASLLRRASAPVDIVPLRLAQLAAQGLLNRPTDTRNGEIYDLTSNAPCSTEFSVSRFLVPHLAQVGWALFVDADVVFLADVAELFSLADPSKAVQVVKHNYTPAPMDKMDGRKQAVYPRKNWASIVLWNCSHPANLRLSLDDVNRRRGIDLLGFYWLHDEEIGELPPAWNWLVREQVMPVNPKIAHFTLGGPWLPNWKEQLHDDIWLEEAHHEGR